MDNASEEEDDAVIAGITRRPLHLAAANVLRPSRNPCRRTCGGRRTVPNRIRGGRHGHCAQVDSRPAPPPKQPGPRPTTAGAHPGPDRARPQPLQLQPVSAPAGHHSRGHPPPLHQRAPDLAATRENQSASTHASPPSFKGFPSNSLWRQTARRREERSAAPASGCRPSRPFVS